MSPARTMSKRCFATAENPGAEQDVHFVVAGHAHPHLPNELCELRQLSFGESDVFFRDGQMGRNAVHDATWKPARSFPARRSLRPASNPCAPSRCRSPKLIPRAALEGAGFLETRNGGDESMFDDRCPLLRQCRDQGSELDAAIRWRAAPVPRADSPRRKSALHLATRRPLRPFRGHSRWLLRPRAVQSSGPMRSRVTRALWRSAPRSISAQQRSVPDEFILSQS